MGKRQITRERILKASYELFNSQGYSKSTMEDLSLALGMSTKTIYQYFSSKYEILKVIGSEHNQNLAESINEVISNTQLPYIMKLGSLLMLIGKETGKYSQTLLNDLQKNVPDVWGDYQKAWEKPINDSLTSLIKEGSELEYIRNDIPVDIVVEIYTNAIKSLINPQVLSKLPYSLDYVLIKGLKVLFEGILTKKGNKAVSMF